MSSRIPARCSRALCLALACAAPALGGAATSALTRLEPGKWVVKPRGGVEHALCLGDPMQLVRLEHPSVLCRDDTVHEETSEGTIQYTCPGHGYGHTVFKVESGRTATIETQGLVDGHPFSYRAVARRVGAC